MADKCIGNLTLNTKGVDEAIKHVNEELEKLGVGKKINISSKVTAAVKESLKSVETLIQQSEKRIADTADKAAKAIEKIGKTNIDNAKNKASVQKAISLYEKLYNARNRVYELEQKGQTETAAYQKASADVQKYETALSHVAQATRDAARVKKEYDNILEKSVAVKNAAKTEAEAKEVENATKAYLKLLEAKSKVKQLEAEGKQDTQEYLKATQAAGKAYDAFIKYSRGARDAAAASKEAAQARKDLNAVESKVVEDSSKIDYLAMIKQQYFEITDAIKNYNAAKKAGDETGMADAQARIDAAMQEVGAIQQIVNASDMEASAKQQVLNYIQQCTTAEHQHSAEIGRSVQSTSELESQVTGLLTRYLSLMAIIRSINSLIQNTVEYVSEYSNKMSEIQMITLKSDEEVAQLADRYRDIAAEMNVSSLSMADAAIYFTRQGLGAEEIEKRLKNVTMYAKAANVEFKDASEIITAVVNSMGLVAQEAEDGRNAAQRVADVFLNIGDNAATSGQEIGEAMQKAAASAGAFGVSMEWLASYIAAVSETTRQEARTIGTAFNTIIARLHQIKQTGYNQEDETKVNDIAKALSKIDVVLMDQSGNWRDMEVILEEIAGKWGELDGKTRSYIATTMAGVKQQNVFLALMNDMSKGIENGSRAYELHEKAIESDGVAEQKYAVYLDSVAAAQERLTIAQERFYSMLNQDVIIAWNNALASLLNTITSGAEALSGMNLIIPAIIAGITGISVAVHGLNRGLKETSLIASLLEKHPIMLAIGAAVAVFAALGYVISNVGDQIETVQEKFDRANKTLSESTDRINQYSTMQSDLNKMVRSLGDNTKNTSEDLEEYNGLLNDLASISPEANKAVNDLKNGMIDQKTAAEILNAELEKVIANEQQISMFSLRSKYQNWQPGSANEGTQGVLQNWNTSDFESTEALANIVQTRWGSTANNRAMRGRWFTQEMIDYIYKELNTLQNMGNEKWSIIAQGLWENFFFGGDGSGDIVKQITDEANGMIEEVITSIASNTRMDAAEKSIAQRNLTRMIFGTDGELDFNEYKDIGNKITQFIENIMANGFEIQNYDKFNFILKDLFGKTVEDLFDMANFNIDELIDQPGFVDAIADTYTELLNAGFSKIDIAKLFGSIPVQQWANGIEQMRAGILSELSKSTGEILHDELENGGVDMLMWTQLDLSTLKIIKDMTDAGIAISDIKQLMRDSASVDEFTGKLKELGNVTEDAGEGAEDYFTILKSYSKEIDKFDEYLESLKSGEGISFEDLIDLTKAHPEITAAIGDVDLMIKKLNELKEAAEQNRRNTIREMLLNDENLFMSREISGRKGAVESGSNTFGEYIEYLRRIESPALETIEQVFETLVDEYIKLTGAEEEASDKFKELLDNVKASQEEIGKLDGWIEKIRSGKMSESDFLGMAESHKDLVSLFGDLDALEKKLVEMRNAAAGKSKQIIIDYLMSDKDFFKNSPFAGQYGANTMEEFLMASQGGIQEYKDATQYVEEAAENLVNGAKEMNEAADTWLQAQMKIAEANERNEWAKSNGYMFQIDELQNALNNGGAQAAMDVWSSYDETMRKSISETYPSLLEAMYEIERALADTEGKEEKLEKATEKANKTFDKTRKYLNTKYFKDTADAMLKLEKGTISASEAYDTFYKEADVLNKAYKEVRDAQDKMAKGTEITENDVNDLAKAIGVTANEVIEDFPGALNMLEEMRQAGIETFESLNKEATMRILGIGEADFSKLMSGMVAVQDTANATVQMLLALGQFELEEREVEEGLTLPIVDSSGNISYINGTSKGKYQFLVPKGGNPLGNIGGGGGESSTSNKSGGGGGGGGGGKGSNSGMTEVAKMLDTMSQIDSIQGSQQNYYQSQQKYYQQTGQLQGVIAYMQKEKDVLEDQNGTLEENIRRIEEYMEAKRAEIANLSTTDEKYEEVSDDLDKLQKAHQTYTKQLIDNKTAIESLTDSMDEQRKKIRQMEIDLRDTILKAIQDRESKTKDMLNAEVQMENTILELIKRRYEKEREQIIQTTNMKIESLEKEKDLLSEQLDLRKQQAEQEDKAAKLQQLEAQYQRIIADPTRAKEAQKIRSDIDELREEMAWDIAEQEVKAQQESIDQQITSLEDYIEYVENYYEDLFEHPQKLIEEMRGIIQSTEEEIMAWLKENDETYKNSSENTQKTMLQGWEETYNSMKGIIESYWDEVEEIIAQGDDFIIEFLKNNSSEYAQAGRLQAEAYVEEWRKKLEELRKAYEEVIPSNASDYDVIEKGDGSGGSGGGGGGSGGGSGAGGDTKPTKTKWGVALKTRYGDYTGYGESNTESAAKQLALSDASKKGNVSPADILQSSYWKVYRKGGLANYTGPAWVDGSSRDPERILSPYQTKLFETMVDVLERMSTISISSMPNMSGIQTTGGNPVSVGDIIVNVDNLDTDDDYEELAEKVGEVLMERIGRTAVVGGLHIRSI